MKARRGRYVGRRRESLSFSNTRRYLFDPNSLSMISSKENSRESFELKASDVFLFYFILSFVSPSYFFGTVCAAVSDRSDYTYVITCQNVSSSKIVRGVSMLIVYMSSKSIDALRE